MDNIHGKVEHYGHWSIKNKFGKYFTEHGITTNQPKLDVFPQNNSYDCGLYAIANMVSLAYGKDPTQQRYDRRKLRSHLFASMERKKFSPFPTLATRKVKKSVKKTHRIPVYCVCRFPDTHTLYVICDGCNADFHPSCIGISEDMLDNIDEVYCPNCSQNKMPTN